MKSLHLCYAHVNAQIVLIETLVCDFQRLRKLNCGKMVTYLIFINHKKRRYVSKSCIYYQNAVTVIMT